MENLVRNEASISADGKSVIFIARIRGRDVHCSIPRRTLEQYFWAPNGANEARLLKSYVDGRKRIVAVVERKSLKSSGKLIALHDVDFRC